MEPMNKKLATFALIAALLALCPVAAAQQTEKIRRIGFLTPFTVSDPHNALRLETFRQGLRDLGYVGGKNIIIEYRFAEGRPDRLPDLAAELVRLKVDAILTSSTPGVLAAKNASSTIPIIMIAIADPVGSGIVASLARPGGNVTGLTILAPELSGKRLELLKEIVPKLSRTAVLGHVANPSHENSFKEMEAAANLLGMQLQLVNVKGANDFEDAFSTMKLRRAQALILLVDALFTGNQRKIADLATKNGLPGLYPWSEFVESGALMSYGPNFAELYRRAAVYVDKILKGAKPADLPVEQPTKFELVINLKTAKQIGLTIPPNVLARADKVIK